MFGSWMLLAALSAAANPAFHIHTVAGSNLAGDGGPAAQATLRQVEGLALKSDGTLYLADAADHRVRVISPAGTIQTAAGSGAPGSEGDSGPAAKARLNAPYGLSLDRAGNLYIADLGNARIRVVGTDGNIRTVAGGGQVPLATADGTKAVNVKLLAPRNVLADDNGGFYFSDFDAHRVLYVDASGTLTTFAGTGAAGYGADNIAATRSTLRNPAGLAFDTAGAVVIVESGSQRLRRVARGLITSYLPDFLRLNPLFGPTGIAIDGFGTVYVADSRTTGALKRTAQGETVALPLSGRAVVADSRGGAYFAGSAVVKRVDAQNKAATVAGGETLIEPAGDGLNVETARFAAPSGMVTDAEGNLYIADERAHRVRKITPAGKVSTVAGNGLPVYSGDGGPAIRAGLHAPRGLAIDRFHNLYIADSGNHAVRRVSPNGTIYTVTGNGFKGSGGDGGPATAAQFNSPSGVALGAFEDLLIADSGNNRIRRISPLGIVSTYAEAAMSDPRGLAADAGGNLYIADTGNSRIVRVDPAGNAIVLADGPFRNPRDVAISRDGAVYVADTGNHRISLVAGPSVTQVAGNGEAGFDGDGGDALAARLQFPSGVALDRDGNVLIADTGNYRVRRLTAPVILIGGLQAGLRVRNAASGAETAVVAGMLMDLEGDGFPGVPDTQAALTNGQLPNRLGGVEVLVNGIPAGLVSVSARRMRLRAPPIRGQEAVMEVMQFGQPFRKAVLPVAEAAPALFPSVVLEDGTAASVANPAARGSVVMLFGTGEGGQAPENAIVSVLGYQAQLVWGGALPHMPGVFQLNIRVPAGFYPSGEHPLELRMGPFLAASRVTLPIQ